MGLQTNLRKFVRKSGPLMRLYRTAKDRRLHNDDWWRKGYDNALASAATIPEPYKQHEASEDVQTFFAGKDKFVSVVLEINNNCNLNCPMCQTNDDDGSLRKKGVMSDEMLDLSIQRMLEIGRPGTISLHTIGDPLANPNFRKVLDVMRAKGLTGGYSTNGQLLHKHIDTLLEYADVCGAIRFSVDGATKESYEKLRLGGTWETLLESLELAKRRLASNNHPISIITALSTENIDEVGIFIEQFRDYVQFPPHELIFSLVGAGSPDTSFFDRVKLFGQYVRPVSPCGGVFAPRPYMLVDGRVSLCSRDYDGSLVIGDIHEKPLLEMLDDEPLAKLRQAHRDGDLTGYRLCQNCFTVDNRISDTFRFMLKWLLHRRPREKADFYQEHVDRFRQIAEEPDTFPENYRRILESV